MSGYSFNKKKQTSYYSMYFSTPLSKFDIIYDEVDTQVSALARGILKVSTDDLAYAYPKDQSRYKVITQSYWDAAYLLGVRHLTYQAGFAYQKDLPKMLTDIGWKIDEESLKHKNKVFQASKYLLDYVPKATRLNDIIGKNSDKEFKKVLENLNKDPTVVEETDKALDNLVPNNQDFEGVEVRVNEIRQNEIRRIEENQADILAQRNLALEELRERERDPIEVEIIRNLNNPFIAQNIRPGVGFIPRQVGGGGGRVRVDWGQNFADLERRIINRDNEADPNIR